MENMNQHEPEMEMSAEELAAKKADMLKFYEDSIPYLDAQLNYEKKLAEIDEVRFRRAQFQVQMAMMMNPQNHEEFDEEEETEREDLIQHEVSTSKERKLKKQ
jgi:hypothetical protein